MFHKFFFANSIILMSELIGNLIIFLFLKNKIKSISGITIFISFSSDNLKS